MLWTPITFSGLRTNNSTATCVCVVYMFHQWPTVVFLRSFFVIPSIRKNRGITNTQTHKSVGSQYSGNANCSRSNPCGFCLSIYSSRDSWHMQIELSIYLHYHRSCEIAVLLPEHLVNFMQTPRINPFYSVHGFQSLLLWGKFYSMGSNEQPADQSIPVPLCAYKN